jgi:hypothetical protein
MLSGAPQLPDQVTVHDVVPGFVDPRLELQYRRLKAMHVKMVDRGALLLLAVREATVVWRLGRRLALQGSSQLSLVLLCKYEAVKVLPYMVSLQGLLCSCEEEGGHSADSAASIEQWWCGGLGFLWNLVLMHHVLSLWSFLHRSG